MNPLSSVQSKRPSAKTGGRLIKLQNESLELGVIPDLGGMTALFNLKGRQNVLKSDSTLWDAPPSPRRKFGPLTRWRAYNGHIVWLGPQSEWWTQQTTSVSRREKRAVWPPDPYINQGYFKITEKSGDSIIMAGPPSEFSGVELTKQVKITGANKVQFSVKAKNIRDTSVSWDLWLNTRVDGYARCYVPLLDSTKVRFDGRETGELDMSTFLHDNGYFYIEPLPPSNGKSARWAKAFIPAGKGFMAAFTSSQVLIIRFKKHAPQKIHPEHSLVEIYNYTNQNRDDALTELEYHAPYLTLDAGESMETSEEWELYPFDAEVNHNNCIDFLRRHFYLV
ncbi:MAG: DUF4380 domain-containing protein [Chitinispirillales bacterium]|nr:DUF4380 domain-containing protein [Chitinispirillales bacterium]